jgi:hypothetical protein
VKSRIITAAASPAHRSYDCRFVGRSSATQGGNGEPQNKCSETFVDSDHNEFFLSSPSSRHQYVIDNDIKQTNLIAI